MNKKNSNKWQKICYINILDPDGWDRKNYDYSWNDEKITRKEFEKRMITSTILSYVSWNSCIWKDQPYKMFWYIKRYIVNSYRKLKKYLNKDKQ